MEDLQESFSSSFPLASSSSHIPNPHPLSIGGEIWLIAELRTQEILCTIQPNIVSEQRRKDVIDYVQRLIRGYYGTEVFPFGSVPLKTYLPDGDIDLTVLSHRNVEDDLASDVCSILEGEEQDPEFQVKGVQYIHAQVKIVKCTVKNIAVDISFNQVAGLCTLCFLEQVDQFIGKDHLFKRSIILIKGWCYYESRILGAHCGLISTYALETLVLFIINFFHQSLDGPLAVLYRFLYYYSTFDWDSYCVSINGPVPISSHPEIMSETPQNDGDELLLSREFLRNCREIISVPTGAETGGLEFPFKNLNIVDPLKGNNNLGRSVSKGNFHRIRCALSYGAQKLGEILMLPAECLGEGLWKFFVNTIDRNGRGQRLDIQVPVPSYGSGRSEVSDLSGDYNSYYSSLRYGQWYHKYAIPVPEQPSPPSSPSQVRNKSPRDTLHQLMQCNRYVLSQRHTNVFVPRQFCHLYGMEIGKSGGTGTFIPDMTHHCSRARNPESAAHCLLPKPPQEIPSEINKDEHGGCHGFSLEEFPLLPSIKKPSKTHQSGQLKVKSAQAKDSFPPLESIEFGTFGNSPSPLGLPSAADGKQADSSVLSTMDSMSAVQTSAMQGQELLERDEAVVLVQQYHLKDSKDFPLLSPVVVSKKGEL